MTLGAGAAGRDVLAVQMTWGAVNEWSTQAGYAQLARRSEHATLGALLGRIMRREGRHIDFYASRARARLAASGRARWLTRQALRHLWHPVGAGVMPPAETDFLIRHLFGDTEGHGLARRIDRRIDRCPACRAWPCRSGPGPRRCPHRPGRGRSGLCRSAPRQATGGVAGDLLDDLTGRAHSGDGTGAGSVDERRVVRITGPDASPGR